MFSRVQNSRVIAIAVALMSLIVLAACAPGQQAQAVPGQQTAANNTVGGITVVGMGEAFGRPDRATAQVGVEIFAPTVEEATSQNQTIIDSIMAALLEQGIAAEDIQTSNYNLYAEQIYGERGPEGIAGYRVNNQVSVIIRDIDQVGDVLAAAIDAGANSIYGVTFSVADPAGLEDEARAEAIADAERRAASLAELNGLTLGEPVLVSEVVGQNVPMPMMGGGAFDMAVQESAAPGISPGQLSYQTQVQVTYATQ